MEAEANSSGYRAVVCALAVAAGVFGFAATWAMGVTFFDFDLHYLAAELERTGGSFVDNAQVQAMADRAGRPVDPLGVFGTPALIALVYVPLSLLNLDAAHVAWSVICVIAIVVSTWRIAGTRRRWPALILALMLSGSMAHSLALGNASTLTFACIAFAFGALMYEKRNQAGVALGLAIAFKAYPAVLLLPLLATKRWREVIAAVITCIVAYGLTFVILGPSDFAAGMNRLVDVGGGVLDRAENSGIPGLIVSTTDSQTLGAWVGRACIVAATALVLVLRKRMPVEVLFALAAMLMLLTQAITWRHYYAIALIALVALLDRRSGLSRRWHLTAVACFVAATGYHQWIVTNTIANSALVNSIYVAGAAGLATLIVVASVRRPLKEAAR